MIRRGRIEGWLKQPIQTLPTWSTFHGVIFKGVKIGPLPGFENRGSTVIAAQELRGGEVEPLLKVPKDLIISRENINLLAKSDMHLRQLLDAAGDFGRTTRGAVLLFLLLQATICCPDIRDIGVLNPLTEYIKYLPDELLPTFWTEEEQELLTGTTLQPAVRAKLNSLLREFETVRSTTGPIDWCAKHWWSEDTGLITFEDWMLVDAMYRSRALEFPGAGDCMMPCIDMANHASGNATAALYETDDEGNGLLLLRTEKFLQSGDEITITYGDEKGACENIFSYGFLEDTMKSAKVMFLDLDIPDDDPLRPAKMYVSSTAPGFRLFEHDGGVDWESDFIWLVVINEEDGLDFKVKQTTDGAREIQALWKDQEFDTVQLKGLIQQDPAWEIFQLRAIVLLQNRIEMQLQTIQEMKDIQREASVREIPWKLAEQLRNLELNMLKQSMSSLEEQKSALLQTESVKTYLGLNGVSNEDEEEDFS